MQSSNGNFEKINLPVFFGLSHLGQVFSLCWSKKIGNCYVFDNNKKVLNSFKERKYTLEEPNLNKLKSNNIKFLKKFEDIKNFKYIFFTHDTPLNIKNGKPELNYIYQLLLTPIMIAYHNYIIVLINIYIKVFFTLIKILKKIDYYEKQYFRNWNTNIQ